MNESFTFKRGLTVKNRAMMAPMTIRLSAYNGKITTDELNYYEKRTGEIGTIITAATNTQDNGKGFEGQPSVTNDEMIPGLSKLASRIKEDGTKAILQLHHAGRISSEVMLRGEQPVAPSSVRAYRDWVDTPRELTEDEIYEIIENFKHATVRAMKAGFDGVELHGANTYLIQQFFSPHSNRRNDKWGGSRDNRYRFIDLLIDEVTALVDNFDIENFIIGYRFSPEEIEEPGIRFDDTLYLIDKLADKPLDYLHISLRSYTQVSVLDKYKEKSILAYVHEQINGRVPLVGVGGILTSEDANETLNHSEFFALGNAILMDPHWVSKAINGEDELIRTRVTNYDLEEQLIPDGALGTMKDEYFK